MIPRMTEIGTNLEEAQNLKTQHDEVIKNLVAKQDQIGSLLTQADNQVSTQQFYGDVYAAMAKSLGQAWKDLTRQMETRQKLLDQAVDFYRGAKQYNDNLADGIRECRTMSLPSDPRDVERQQQRTRQIKKDMLEGSMQVMTKGRDLLDRLHDLGSKAGDDSRHATMVSCQGVEKAMEDIQDKRRLLDDLWLERSRKLDQYQHLRDIDTEVTKISNWFRTQGEMYLQKRNIGRSENECSDLLKHHHAFEVAAGDVQNSVANLLATSEQVRHSDPESTERLRSQTRAIDTLCDDFMHRLGERRNTLQRAHDFYRNAELAKTYLSRLGVQLSQERLPKDEWSRTNRLDKLNNAISEISTPVLGEGRALLNQVGLSTPGAETVKENMAEIQAKCVDLQNQARPELREQAEMQATFEEKYTVLIKWLVNVGDAFLMANNDMGDQMQTTMDFLDGHEKLLTEVREKSTQVDNVMAIATKLGSKNRFTPEQTNKLKQHWTRVTVTVENRIRAAHIFIKFHKVTKQLGNAMENMETMLKSEEMRDVKRMNKTTMQHIHEKWNQMVEINIQLDNTGHTFKNELHKLVNDTELVTKTSVHYVELTIKSFGERKIYLDDLYDSLHQKYSAEETFKSQWEHFVRDARKTIEFVINMEGNVFPRLTSDAQSLADVKQKKIDSFQETVTRVTTEIQMRLKTAEMLGAKGDTGGEKEQVVERLTSAHHRFMNRVGEYQIVLTLSIDFYKKVNKVNKTMDEAIASYQIQPAPSHTSEAQIKLQQHEEEKRYITELYTTAAKKGDEVIAKIRQSDPVSPARRDVEVTLQAMEERKEHWLNEWSRYRQRLTKASEDTSLKLLKSEFIIHLQRAEDELDGMRKSKESVSLTIEKFTDWEAQIKVLEDQYQHYLSTAHIALKGKPADKPGIQKDIQDVQTYWSSFMKNVDDYRKKMELVVNLRKQYTTLVSNLKLADRQLQDLQQPQVSETLTIEKFQDWQVHIKGLEKEYTNYVSRANIVLDQKPPASTLIERELNEVKNFWVGFNKSVQDYRDKMQLVANIRMQYKTLIMNMEQAEDDLKDLESTPHSSSLIIEKHEDWEAHIKVLEDEYEKYVSSAHIALDRRPPSAGVIEKDLAEAERYWSKLNRQIHDYRHKVEVIFNIHKRFKTLAVRIQKATKHVEELKTDFGQKAEDLPEIQKRFATFEQDVKPLEVEHKDFVTVATTALAKNPPNASAIKRDVDDINRFWSKLNVSLQDQRKKLKTAPKFHDLYKTVVEWQVKAEDLLVAVGQKKPLFTAQEQAAEVLGEVEDFIEKGDARQKARLFKLNEMAIDLYSHKVPPRVTSTINTNRELLDAIQVTNDELFALANNLPKQTPVQAKADETVVPQVQRTVQTVPLVKSQKPVPAPPGLVDESVLPVSQKPVETKPWQPPPPPKAVQESVVPQYQKPAQMKQWKAPRPVRQVAEIILPDEQTSDAEIPLDRLPETSTKTVQLVQPESPITQTRKEPVEAFPTFPAPEPEPPKPVGYAPYFTRKIRDNLVKQGRATQLDCVVKGDPAPEVEWYKDGVPVRTSNNLRVECGDEGLCALSFYNTQPEADGVYTIKAFNVIGEAACKAKLNVQAVQEEFVLPKQVPKVSTGHIQLTHNALMPKFIQIPGDKNVEEGKPLCLEVVVDAYPDPNVVWSKDGIKVKGEPYILKEDGKTHTLIIPEADLEDEGIFICTATNPAGRAECIIQVKVNEAEEPPVFITPLMNAQAKKGAPFAFECVLKGDPVPVVEWLKNNKPVNADNPDYNLKRNTETGTCRLEIDEVFPEDAARYTCRATNEAGKAETTSMLSVMEDASPTPPWIQPLKLESSYLEIPVGQPIKLAFKVSGNPEPTVTWHHNDRPLRPDGRIKVVKEDTTYTMQIGQAEPEDTGKYTIRAENEKGQESSSVEINVPRPPVVIPIHQEEVQSAPAPAAKTPPGTAPRFKTRLKDLVIPDGQPFELTCKVAGVPVPNIVWYKDNKELTENEPQYELSFMESVACLDVREAFLEDAGLYTCQATNNHGRDVTSGRVEVKSLPQAPPVIKPISHESSHLDIPVGQPIVLKFNIEAFPSPVVRWYHDGVPVKETPEMEIINEETDYKLVIKEAKPEYAGTYTVVAENDKGQESTSIEIDVVPPVTQMEVVPSQAEPMFAPLQSRFFTQPDAMPLMGAATPPRFQSRLKDIEVTEGEPIEIAIRVTGQPTPRITWYKDDKPIAGKPQYEMSFVESVARLDVREAFLEDEGRYVCKATNPAGQDTTTCQITVKVNAALVPAPHITPLQTQYSHLDIPVGQPIRLHFRIRGQPPPKVTWLQNDVEIVETEEVEIIKEETVHTLVIKNPRPDAGGKYTVVAENDRGTETVNIVINVSGVTVPMPTGPGPVVVRPSQPIVFTEHLTDKQVVESTEIKLRVRIEEKPTAQVQWFFNNTPIQSSDRVEFLRDGDVYYLVIKKPTSGDAGLYQCRAETEVSVVTTECTIMVNEKQSPDFIAPLESLVASEGSTIRLECRVSGSPAPTVKWTKDERSITETSRVRFLTEGDRQILMILQVRPSDSGNYRITLTNEFGVSVSSSTLLVDGEKDVDDRPTIVIRLNDQEVQPGDRVQFRVKIQGTPQPAVQWFKNSIEIQTHPYIEISQTGEHNMLTIPKVGPQDAGTYSVVATNDNGRDVSAATLVVDVPKTPTAAPHFAQTFGNRRCYEGESLTFECRITGDPKPSVSWFKDGVKVEQGVFQISEDGQFHKLEILEVFDEDAGVFECRAKNDYGEAICVATLRIKGELSPKWKSR
ncbi:titin-like isoform X4 [Lytechinus pictus]|uniref:titin-like isoform X4 n=1 Tax=Lytechinus pictus TaxID=7653 RepID=UPI0030B9FDC1